jgi:hypothetical protein
MSGVRRGCLGIRFTGALKGKNISAVAVYLKGIMDKVKGRPRGLFPGKESFRQSNQDQWQNQATIQEETF